VGFFISPPQIYCAKEAITQCPPAILDEIEFLAKYEIKWMLLQKEGGPFCRLTFTAVREITPFFHE
jgi:hypothetical protein